MLDHDIKLGLEILLTSIANGKHALVAEHRNVYTHFLNADIHPKCKQVLRVAHSSHAEIAGLIKDRKYVLRIEASCTKNTISQSSSSTTCEWNTSLQWIADRGTVPESSVVVENHHDYDLFLYAAKQYQEEFYTKKFSVSIRAIAGGGSQTPVVYDRALRDQNEFVLCIIDSDKICPSQTGSQMTSDCSRLHSNKLSTWVTHFSSLPVREVENIIPVTLIEDMLAKTASAQQPIANFDELKEFIRQQENKSYWYYLDLKEGTKISSLSLGNCASFWQQVARDRLSRRHANNSCLSSLTCRCSSHCLIVPGISNNLLAMMISYLDPDNSRKSSKELWSRAKTSHNFTHWEEVGRLVSLWGMAMPKVRS